MAPGGGHPSVRGDALEAPESQHRRHRAQRQRERAVDGDRDQMAGGGVAGPQHHRGDGQDGELPGREVGEDAVLALDVGWDAHTAAVPVACLIGGAHSPTPAARALAPL